MGHEVVGIVAAIGSAVQHVKVGDRVGVDPNSDCGGTCFNCSQGNPHLCTNGALEKRAIGVQRDGGFAELLEISDFQVHHLPKELELVNGFIVETLSCVYHGRELLGPLDPGSKILILGSGVVGLIWGSLLHHEGHREISISEPRESRRETALGLNVFKNVYTPEALSKAVGDNTSYDLIIDCCGVGAAVKQSMEWVKRGGTFLVFACAAPSQVVDLSLLQICLKEIRILGSLVNPLAYAKSIPLALAMQERYLNVEKLGIQSFPLTDFEKAFSALRSGAITKGVFEL